LAERVLELGWKVRDASQAAGISERTVYKWLSRFKAEGPAGLCERSSRPAHGLLTARTQPARQWCATSAQHPASCLTWTPRSLAGSTV
jgi:transposase